MKTSACYGWVLLLVLSAGVLSSCHSRSHRQLNASEQDSAYKAQTLANLSDSIQQHPDSAHLYFERGGLYYVMKQYDLAGKDIQHAIRMKPLEADYLYALGDVYLALHRLDSAEQAYRMAVNLRPDFRKARLQVAYLALQTGHPRMVLLQTDTLLQLDSALAEAYGLKSQALQRLGDTARAIGVMQRAVALSPDNYDALMALGDLLAGRQPRHALGCYRKAALADSTQGEPWYGMALVYLHMNLKDQAQQAFRHCIQTDPYYIKAYMKLGSLYQDQKDWKMAQEVFNLAGKMLPTDAEAYYQRGYCEEQMQQYGLAKMDYNQALSLKDSLKPARDGLNRIRTHVANP